MFPGISDVTGDGFESAFNGGGGEPAGLINAFAEAGGFIFGDNGRDLPSWTSATRSLTVFVPISMTARRMGVDVNHEIHETHEIDEQPE